MKCALRSVIALVLASGAGASLGEEALGNKASPGAPTALVVSAHQVTLWALANNLEVSIESINPELRATNVMAQLAAFDPAFFATSSFTHQVRPLATTTVEGEKKYIHFSEDNRSRREILLTSTGLRKKLATGGTASVEFGTGRDITKDLSVGAVTDVSPPVTSTSLTLNLSQPLLRGRGRDYNLVLIRAARNNEKVAHHNLVSQMMKVASQAQQAYWMLVFVRSDLGVKQTSLARANGILEAIRTQVELGKSAELELTRARANVAAKQEGIIRAQQAVKDAEDDLRGIINLQDDDLLEEMQLVPVDDGLAYEPRQVNLEQAAFQALNFRPALAALKTSIENRRLDRNLAKNQLLPALDLQAAAGLNGFEDGLVPALEFFPKGSFYTWQLRLNFELPFDNRAARANYTRSKLQLEQDLLRLHQLEDDIRLEVKQRVRQVDSNLARIQAAKVARELAEKAARQEKVKYEEGISTFLELSQAEEALEIARSQEVAAMVDYHISLVRVQRATGTILSEASLVPEPE